MQIDDYEKELDKLRKVNRIIAKKLERSEIDRTRLEETNEKKEILLKNVINDLEESQNKLAQRSQELEQTLINLQMMQNKMSVLGNLVADVAHEINNPVGFILGNLDPAEEYINSHWCQLKGIASQICSPIFCISRCRFLVALTKPNNFARWAK